MGVRGSIWSSVFIVGPGGPGGNSGPCAKTFSTLINMHRTIAIKGFIMPPFFVNERTLSRPAVTRKLIIKEENMAKTNLV